MVSNIPPGVSTEFGARQFALRFPNRPISIIGKKAIYGLEVSMDIILLPLRYGGIY